MRNNLSARCRLRGVIRLSTHTHILVLASVVVSKQPSGPAHVALVDIPLYRTLELLVDLHFCVTLLFISFLFQSFSKKAVDHVQSHLAKKQVPPTLFQVKGHCTYLCMFLLFSWFNSKKIVYLVITNFSHTVVSATSPDHRASNVGNTSVDVMATPNWPDHPRAKIVDFSRSYLVLMYVAF